MRRLNAIVDELNTVTVSADQPLTNKAFDNLLAAAYYVVWYVHHDAHRVPMLVCGKHQQLISACLHDVLSSVYDGEMALHEQRIETGTKTWQDLEDHEMFTSALMRVQTTTLFALLLTVHHSPPQLCVLLQLSSGLLKLGAEYCLSHLSLGKDPVHLLVLMSSMVTILGLVRPDLRPDIILGTPADATDSDDDISHSRVCTTQA